MTGHPPEVVTRLEAVVNAAPGTGLHGRILRPVLMLLICGLLAVVLPAGAALAQPAPSDTSTVGQSVTNPVTSNTTTVSDLLLDPAGTPTAGEVAFVETADGYVFLVKGVGETFYNNDNPPVGFTITQIVGTTATFTTDGATNPADVSTQLTLAEFNSAFAAGSDTAGTTQPPDSGALPGGGRVDIIYGQNGSNGRAGALFVPPRGGGDGSQPPPFAPSLSIDITTAVNPGWTVGSQGGRGGNGGSSNASFSSGGSGGDGGPGGTLNATQTASSTIVTTGSDNIGIFAFSRSGRAGNGGGGNLAPGGGAGGNAADGGTVTLTANGEIATNGQFAHGIYALSQSRSAGNGGGQIGLVGTGGGGGSGADGGDVTVNLGASGSILTQGAASHGLFALSVGGSGGSGGSSSNLILSFPAGADAGGNGGRVTVSNAGRIETQGDFSKGILAQSVGGGGGESGGGGGLFTIALGGAGGGGNSDPVLVTNQSGGMIVTQGFQSDGILAQSIGGSGGAAGNSGGLVAIGGNGGSGGSGDTVTVRNFGTIQTAGTFARGMVAQSIGGGGGDGGRSGGLVAVGGRGAGGGNGASVTVVNEGIITTGTGSGASDAIGILAQSIGGGGGNGGSTGAIGLFASVAVGGDGAGGGNGGNVNVTLSDSGGGTPSSIQTNGARSTGVFAQSVGGGGGNGGGAFSASVGAFGSASVAVGGEGAAGGAGGEVVLTGTGDSAVQTNGSDSTAVFLQSVGGGGGSGGYAASFAVSAGPVSGSIAVGVGGRGGGGGAGGLVRVGTVDAGGNLTGSGFSGSVLTNGARSTGLLLQSVGGGGGNGGMSIAGSGAASLYFSGNLSVSVGGSGGVGGAGGRVQAWTDAGVTTQGASSTAILAQSVGGGGGNGGGSIAAGIAGSGGVSASINAGVGGSGGNGAIGGRVDLISTGTQISTFGQFSSGVVAQSVGGGGGNGGYAVGAGIAGSGGLAGAVNVGVGGSAGTGGNGGIVAAEVASNVITRGSDAGGVLVQSVGGGGGNGGFSVSAGIAGAGGGAATVGVSLGGSGGAGGTGGTVTAEVTGNVETGTNDVSNPDVGDRSPGVVVQSIGGGGGNGGFSVSGSLNGAGAGSGAIDVGLGGAGSSGGSGGTVTATVDGTVLTRGDDSTAVLAQSVGGGGGSGGFNVSANATGSGVGSGSVAVGLGGAGGGGAIGGSVTLTTNGNVQTSGDRSSGVVAQSIGGGGGNGGFNVSGTISGAGVGSGSVAVGLGGSAGTGQNAGAVNATSNGTILTTGIGSSGFVAQSIGGGGGNGGFNVSAALSFAGTGSGAVGVGLGGSGGAAGNGGTVIAATSENVETRGIDSTGVLVQSVGGGGGNGAFNFTGSMAGAGTGSGAVGVGLGGSGAGGGNGGAVTFTGTNDVLTRATRSPAVVVQSIGGGGGNGGFNVGVGFAGAGTGSGSVGVGLGGRGAGGGNGGTVGSTITGNIETRDDFSTGLLVQSLGGGGGNGGFNVAAAVAVAGTGSGGAAVGLGGAAGSGGTSGVVTSELTGDVTTDGIASGGVVVQSLGGGGGNGGMNISATITAAGTGSGGAAVGIGGSGGTGGGAEAVTSTVTGNVVTRQIQSTGVLVQSAGGGGGNGGLNVSGALNLSGTGGGAVAVGIGGAGGGASAGNDATSTVTGDVTTLADDSTGVLVQSLGGGGGNGGLNVSGAVSLAKSGSAAAAIGIGGFGGDGGGAGTVDATFNGNAITTGNQSAGLVAQAIGGGGGNGGVNVSGAISLSGNVSGSLGFGLGGFGGGGGTGGSVEHDVDGTVSTTGVFSTGVLTQSVGGGGGNGGTNVTAALNFSKQTGGAVGIGIGGFGGGASNAGAMTTSSVTGTVTTAGAFSTGILTQSVGGAGGNGATNVTAGANLSMNNGGALSFGMGGFGGGGGNGRTVSSTIRTSTDAPGIRTTGVESIGALAQSVGGGGGAGGTNVSGTINLSGQNGAAISLGLGGFGGAGGESGAVAMDVIGDVLTMGDRATGLVAQSIAGGGGTGGTNVSGALTLSKPGGSNTILSIAAGVGGFGGGGGNAGSVDFDYSGDLQAVPMTMSGGSMVVDLDKGSDGIVAQSLGGGGGNGGVNVTGGISIASFPSAGQSNNNNSGAVLVGVGGFGGTGGDAGTVDVDIAQGSTIRAHGTGRSGVIAQSLGGGGGNGGLNVSTAIVSDSSLIVGVGGLGGNAGIANDVTVTARADITVTTDPEDIQIPDDTTFETRLREVLTDQVVDEVSNQLDSFALRDLMVDLGLFNEDKPDTDGSAGLLAQSIGGGGGNGGLNVSGGVAINKDGNIPSITFGIGGFGGAGNVSGDVTVDHGGTIAVAGNWKHGMFAQSIAGGGGNGGLNVSGQLNYQASESGNGQTDLSIVAGLGGHGGTGADAGNVDVTSTGEITSEGYASRGVFAQSIGGGGGTGGINVSAVGTQNSSPIGIGVGGFGANGGHAGNVTVNRGTVALAAGLIQTDGIGAVGLEASSIGGGGGNAGVNAVIGVTRTTGSQSNGGTAGDRRTPTNTGVDPSVITNYNAVLDELEGNNSSPAPGGGGGRQTNAVAIAIGGGAGSAGNGGVVDVNHFGTITTADDQSHGILGQSLGGGGGNAAFNLAFMYQAGQADNNRALGLSVGGGTGAGGNGGQVDVASTGAITTAGDDSHGVFAQSVGGGGGNAGYNMLSNSADGGSANITIGRRGGTGGTGGDVIASSDGDVRTQGLRSHGLFAQSIGNGGGNSSTTSISLSTPKEEDDKGTSLSLSVGLEGGQGGSAGVVTANAAGTIGTMGEEAHGVFAQSVGGGGGTAGSAKGGAGEGTSINVALGGTGGTGGTGGAVSVTSLATIATVSDRAIGIFAQSIGGAGGTGGAVSGGGSNLSTVISNVKGSNVGTTASLLIGGTGGVGMTSGTVGVDNSGVIVTAGDYAHGVLAQSVGGGGGQGGVVDNKIVNLRGNIGNQYTVGLGGNGGSGAVSETVTVTNSAEIGTSGARALGIFAQSVGGGGGDAQYVRNIVVGPDANGATRASLLMGGSGGSGAAAGDVTVANTATGRIITTADAAHGILAQSIGGGGGTGGDVSNVALNRSTSATGTTSRTFQIGIGGSGGDGGTGGDVTVTNGGLVQTGGAGAHGIIAQSVGGGGGQGGQTIDGSFTLASGDAATPSTAFSLGGSGGNGNTGGNVVVNNTGNILVQGDAAYGILAQSIGGGGGNGGMSIAVAGDRLADQATGRAFNSIAIGGAGGDGADAGDVTVNHTGTIQVDGDNAYGILAQSVSGAGGNAGISVGAPLVSALDYGFSTLLGARSGANGTVGSVDVRTDGDIIMNGANSKAVHVQAVNGGGGNVEVFTIFSENLPTGPQAAEGTTILGALGLGGEDVDGTAGSNVAQSHTGNVMTMQANSTGALTQSIGGGGGTALSQVEANAQTDLTLNGRLGARSTDNAPGGAIAAQRTGSVMTQGAFSAGGLTQSIGGGGGRLMFLSDIDGSSTQTANVVMGTNPSFFNPGGDVSLALTGDTLTFGDFAHGQVVQSIGAGGGETLISGMSSANVTIGGQGGSTGDGGMLDVTHDGLLTTQGRRAHGFVLQSIGGGGGLVTTDLDGANVTVTPSADNGGDGGAIGFTNMGNVMTMGDEAVSILAQSLGGGGGLVDYVFRGSAGGAGNGGTIDIAQTGNVIATGADAVAVLAQSEGGTGTGADMTLSFGNVVFGGSGTRGVAVRMDGGRTNSLTLGTDAFLGALNDEVIRGGIGDETVSLAGIGFGNLDLGTGSNSFTLEASGRFTALDRMLAGAGGQVSIEGDFQVGGVLTPPATITPTITASDFMIAGNVNQTTTVTGSLGFTATATYTADVYFLQQDGSGQREGDLIDVSENGTMGGELVPVLNTLEQARPYVLIDVGGTPADGGTTIQDTIVLDYSIGLNGSTGDGSTIDLVVVPDFSTPGMNGNESAVGDYINDVLNGAGSAAMGRTFALIANAGDEAEVIGFTEGLTTEDYAATQVEAFGSALRFADDLRTCSRTVNSAVMTENGCIWSTVSVARTERDGSAEFRRLEASAVELQLGRQFDLQNGLKLAFAIESGDVALSSGESFIADGDRWQVGVSLEREVDNWILFGALSLGQTTYSSVRRIGINGTFGDGFALAGGTGFGEQDVSHGNLRFGAAYRHELPQNDWYLQPGLALDITQLRSDAFNETGSTIGATLRDTEQTIYTVTPSLEVGIDTDYDADTAIRAYLRAEALFSSENEVYINAGLPGASLADGGFRNYSGFDDSRGRLTVGLRVFDKDNGFFADVTYGHEFGDSGSVQSGGIQFGLRF